MLLHKTCIQKLLQHRTILFGKRFDLLDHPHELSVLKASPGNLFSASLHEVVAGPPNIGHPPQDIGRGTGDSPLACSNVGAMQPSQLTQFRLGAIFLLAQLPNF